MRRPVRILLPLLTSTFLFLAASIAVAAQPRPVLTSRLDEKQPASSGIFLAWAQNSRAAPRHFDVFVRRGDGRPYRVNPSGTAALMGGLDGTTLVYQLIRGRRSNLAFYDVATRRALHTPAGLTMTAWQWSPTISSSHVMFGLGNPGDHRVTRKVLLYDRISGSVHTLATTAGGAYSVSPGQVNGDYAVYWQCYRVCAVVRYRISTGHRTRVPTGGRQSYVPSVTADGTVYFARSGFGCGSGVALFRFRNGAVTRVAALPAGVDVGRTFAWTGPRGPTTVYFDRIRCTPPHIDIYELVDP